MIISKKPEDKEYSGASPLMAGAGRGLVESFVAGIAGAVAGLLIGRARMGSIIGQVAGLVHGAYAGYSDGDKAQKDNQELKTELKSTRTALEEQRSFVTKLTSESKPAPDKVKVPAR